MSKLQDLINRLCPDGVPFKPLGELGEFIRGTGIQKSDFREEGIGCIHYGQIYTHYGTFATETKSFVSETLAKKLRKAKKGNLIIATTSENIEDVGKAVAWLGENDIAVSTDAFIFSHFLNPKFVSYFFQTNDFKYQKRPYVTGTKVMRISGSDLAKILIPVPPLEVQEEIVKILDRFAVYAAELQAELQARKEQYEYYRNLLLTFNPSACGFGTDGEQENGVTAWGSHSYEIQWKTMGEIGTFIRGNGLQKKDFRDSGVGCIHYGQIYTHYGTFATETKSYVSPDLAARLLLIETGDIVMACTGENVDDIGKAVAWLGDKNIVTGGHSVVFKHDQNPKYIAYFMQTDLFFKQKKKYAYGAKVIDIKADDLAKFIIPIPPLELQEKIVSILDRFETLVNDLTEGLPAEIEAVREQYEYYRNKLLTFKQLA